jgi:hypothetical protein
MLGQAAHTVGPLGGRHRLHDELRPTLRTIWYHGYAPIPHVTDARELQFDGSNAQPLLLDRARRAGPSGSRRRRDRVAQTRSIDGPKVY